MYNSKRTSIFIGPRNNNFFVNQEVQSQSVEILEPKDNLDINNNMQIRFENDPLNDINYLVKSKSEYSSRIADHEQRKNTYSDQ